MNGRTTVAVGGGSGIVGFLIGKLTSTDVATLFSKIVDGTFAFLESQGVYASFAIVMTAAFGGLSIWCIRILVNGKQEEIDRVVKERDKFQKLFIDEWRSSKNPQKGAKRK